MQSLHRCLGAAAVVAASMAVSGAGATEPASFIVVVDGSGSMWGTIEGSRQNKLALIRDALRPGLDKIRPQTRVGLAAFGHRRVGDCTDAEMIRAPEPLDVEGIMAPLGQVNPRGRGPLTLALREAAKWLPRDSGPRSLVLIHDDADNCQQDPCAAAAELNAAGITVHVVGLGVKAEDMAKMACLPQTTGGRHFNAQNAEQSAIFIDEALRLAGSDLGAAKSTSAARPAAALVPPAPIPASGPPALHLRALLAPNTELLSIPLHWTVSAEAKSEPAVFDAWAANPVVPVAPGNYVVEVGDGIVSARQTVAVRENRPTAVAMVLGAGTVRVRTIAQKTGAPLNDAIITISNAGGAADGKKDSPGAGGPLIAAFKASEAVALLPAGRFVVRAELGLVRAEQSVIVPAGRPVPVDIPLNAARLQLTTSGRDGVTPLENPIFSIVEDDPDAPRGRREVARSAARQAEFVLPPGTYYVIARQGIVEARERLAIGPGDVIKRTLSASAGRLSLSTKSVGAGTTAGDPVSYTIERIDDPAQEIVTTSRASPVLFLPSGRYRVEGRYGLMNVRTMREVDIRAGQTQQLVLEHQAATLKLRFAGTGVALPEVFWDVRDEAGRTVWTSGQAEPIATLQAGRYLVAAETREKRQERIVELRAGESRLVEVSVD